MTRNQDARPFIDLLKDAEEFKAKFDDDIKKCIEFLDEKITALIRDPDSLGNPKRGANSNPVVEFSKAKYEIFVGAKSLMNEMEREWLKYISEMKKLFIENVEIFLAGTKLEVKLPTSEFQSSPGFKKSPRKQDRSSVTSSIYPLINSFAKNVAALSSPLRVKDNTAKKRSSNRTPIDLQPSSSDETSEDEPVKIGRKSSHFSESLKPTVRITKADESAAKALQRKSISQAETSSDSSESDRKTPSSKSRGTKEKSSTSDLDTSVSKSGGRQSKQAAVDSSPGLNRSRSSSGSKLSKEMRNLSDSPGFNRSRSSSGHRSKMSNEEAKLDKSLDLNRSRTSSKSKSPTLSEELGKLSNSPDLNRSRTSSKSKSHTLSKELQKLSNSPGFEASLSNSRSAGRHRSRKKYGNSSDDDSSDSSREEWTHRPKKSVKTPKQKDASDVDMMSSNRMGSGRKSRQSVRNTKLMNTSVEQQEKDEETDESENEKESSNSKRTFRGRKGKKSVRSTKETIANETLDLNPEKADGKATRNQSKSVNKPKTSTSGEGREINADEQINDVSEASAKKSKGRASTRETRVASRTPARTNRKTVVDDTSLSEESAHSNPKKARHSTRQEASSAAKPKATTTEENEMSETEEDKAPTREKRGKQAAKDKSSDTNVISKTPGRASRRAAAEEILLIERSPKKSNLVRSNESVVSGATKSPKKVTFTKEQVDDDDDDDDLDYTPAKALRPAIRRKTLLPNLDDISDINPGNSTCAKNKRKTIAVSDLRAITPSKRLKVSESMKSVSSSQDDEDTDDNPLESDGNYTHWIPLKSVDAKIPSRPGIYEVKVSRAKKSAYIGSCDSLRQKLTVYKLRHNSGHKHLDKFIDRNMNDIQIRYEVVSSVNDAKTEVKNRINSFVSQYKTTPAYN